MEPIALYSLSYGYLLYQVTLSQNQSIDSLAEDVGPKGHQKKITKLHNSFLDEMNSPSDCFDLFAFDYIPTHGLSDVCSYLVDDVSRSLILLPKYPCFACPQEGEISFHLQRKNADILAVSRPIEVAEWHYSHLESDFIKLCQQLDIATIYHKAGFTDFNSILQNQEIEYIDYMDDHCKKSKEAPFLPIRVGNNFNEQNGYIRYKDELQLYIE